MSARVFISYPRLDKAIAREIKHELEQRGINCFLDETSIEPGTYFPDEIGRTLRDCDVVVVVLTENTQGSQWVACEIREALVAGKQLIPYRHNRTAEIPKLMSGNLQEADNIGELLRAVGPRVSVTDLAEQDVAHFEVPGIADVYSSFHPETDNIGRMYRLKIPTTDGWIADIDSPEHPRKVVNQNVYLIRDPIRPFEIQIGEMRSARPGGVPGSIEIDPNTNSGQYLRGVWDQLIRDPGKTKWERMVLAELATDPELLRAMHETEPDKTVRSIIGKNPATPESIKKKECLFCNARFLSFRQRFPEEAEHSTADCVIINNDYPFGPHFHYIAFPTAPIHSWESVGIEHLLSINLALSSFLRSSKNIHESAGLRIGFNSSVRHVVAGARTRASAGASIAHIHKQAWGMAKGSYNLGDHLSHICDEYLRRQKIDYLASYLETLRKAGMIIAEDKNVALFVPLGQISTHELQIMLKRHTRTFLDLNIDELRSLSYAELAVSRIYCGLGINSYNEILISRKFDSPQNSTFRLIISFVTREIDLAVSELNLLYVTDKHPYDTVAAVNKCWGSIKKSDFPPEMWQ